jgi:hypothetical protein
MLGLWTMRDLQRELYRFVKGISELLEPPEVSVDTLKFEPVRTAAVKVAIEAGWIEGLSDGRSHTPSELLKPGQSEELLGKSSWRTMTGLELKLTYLSPHLPSVDIDTARHRSRKTYLHSECEDKTAAATWRPSRAIQLVSINTPPVRIP